MTARALRLGTRGSALALWQANHVAALISKQPGAPRVEPEFFALGLLLGHVLAPPGKGHDAPPMRSIDAPLCGSL